MFNNSSEKNRYSLRKLSVGLASVLIGISFIEANGQTAKADTTTGGNTATISTKVEKTANGSQNTASDANKGTTASNGSLGVANSASAGQESTKENGSQNYNANDSAEATAAKNEAVKGTIIAAKAALDVANDTKTNSTINANQANTDAKGAVNEAQTNSAEQQSSNNTAQAANGGTSVSDNKSATALDTQTLDVNKNSQKFVKKVLATNLTQDNSTQKDYTPDINAWTGHDDGTYYILDNYTPQNDAEKDLIIIPNEADFEKAGKNINGHEVGITSDTTRAFMTTVNPKEVHFSETNGKKIKAINDSWLQAFKGTNLEAITGKSLDTTNVKTIAMLFQGDRNLNDISALSSWDVSNVSGLGSVNDSGVGYIFQYCNSLTNISPISNWHFTQPVSLESAFHECTKLVDLSPLTNWDVSTVWNFGHTFWDCHSLTDLSPLKNWNTKNVKYWDNMFLNCPNLTNIDAINNWNYSSAGINTQFGNYPLDDMFYGDHKIQINIGTDSGLADFIRRTGRIDAFHNSSNQISTSNTKLIELLTNTDFKSQEETTTAKRIITFSGLPANRAIPPIVQTINYTKLSTAIIDMTGTSDSNALGKIVSSGFEKDWKLDTSKQNDDVIIDGVIYFKPVKIPRIPGYKATWIPAKESSDNSAQAASYSISFMALPNTSDATKDDNTEISNPTKPVDPSDDTKPSIDVPVIPSDPKDTVPKSPIAAPSVPAEVKDTQDITFDEPVEAPAVQIDDSVWHIKNETTTDTSYIIVNTYHTLSLPRFTGYTLHLVKYNAARDAISFVYVNPNKTLKYIFNIKLANGKYILTIGKVSEDGIIQLEKVAFSDYNQLMQLITKAVNK